MQNAIQPRTRSLPLETAGALKAAFDLALEVLRDADAADFDRALTRVEQAVSRCRAAFLTQTAPEADAALAYHDQAKQELGDDFVPMYYRKAVLDNVLARYTRSARTLIAA